MRSCRRIWGSAGKKSGKFACAAGQYGALLPVYVPEYVAQSLPFAGTGGAEAEKRYAVACADAVFHRIPFRLQTVRL